jgi:hypothetical protein
MSQASKGQIGPALPFLLALIMMILIFSSAGCLIGRFTRISDQGTTSFDRLADAITTSEGLSPGEITSVSVYMDKQTAIIGFNAAKSYRMMRKDKEFLAIPFPDQCSDSISCVCYCSSFEDAKLAKDQEFKCKNTMKCTDTGKIEYRATTSHKIFEKLFDEGELTSEDGFFFTRGCFQSIVSGLIIGCTERDRVVYLHRDGNNGLGVCEVIDPEKGCFG